MDGKLTFGGRLKHAWNAFKSQEKGPAAALDTYAIDQSFFSLGVGSTSRLDRPRLRLSSERTIVASLYNRIAIDVSSVDLRHVRNDQNGGYLETIKSGLNECLTVEANVDQTGRELIMDIVMSMFDEGTVAVVPVDTNVNLTKTGSFDILSLRTGKITQWYPKDVKVEVYNENEGKKQEILLPKNRVAIINNPFYSVMNEPNSTLRRLIDKLNLLDAVDNQSSSGKLDLIVQLPYTIKSEARMEEAEKRKKKIEEQLTDSKYGIAYIDATEKITQLNRSLENNLMGQIEWLTTQLYSQLGLSEEVFKGTADEKAMLNYYNTTVNPILTAIIDEMNRKFLTKTARTQGQTVSFFNDPFKLVPVSDIAEIADRFTRNEILSSNEVRAIIGYKPVDDARADELRNKNLNPSEEGYPMTTEEGVEEQLDPNDPDAMSDQDLLDAMDELDEADEELNDMEEELDDEELAQADLEDGLVHYASPYYDPVKAHEYYMKNRELKGRKPSTSDLNDTGKNAASYVKQRLNEERKAKVKQHSDETNNTIKSNSASLKSQIQSLGVQRKSEVQRYSKQMQLQIKKLQRQIKRVGKRGGDTSDIKAQIASLREDNKTQREKLAAEYKSRGNKLREENKSTNKQLREDHKTYSKNLKEEYDQKYADEVKKINEDSSMVDAKKRANRLKREAKGK